jgi:SulP family sulfate permease
MQFDVSAATVRKYVPLVGALDGYRRRDAEADIVAGVVLGFVTIPQAVAYAFLAGLPASAGLYGCLLPMVLYALFGSSRELVVGPVAVTAIMVAEAIRTHTALYAATALDISLVLCFETALVLAALRATSMGGIVNLLSHPVIAGFVNGAVVLIVLSQLAALLGLTALPVNPIEEVVALVQRIAEVNPVTAAIGVGSMGVLWIMRRYGYLLVVRVLRRVGRQHPITRTGPVVVMVLSTIVVALLALDERFAVDVVGALPTGLPGITLPAASWSLWMDLLPNAALIALVTFVESYSIGTAFAGRRHRRIDTDQELVALSVANVGAGLTGAFPVAGSFSRSSVNVSAGARTPASVLVAAVIVVFALFFLTPWLDRLPQAALAAIIIVSVLDLFDTAPIVRDWHFYRYDAYVHVVTFVGVLLVGVEAGLVAGILLSVGLFVRRSSRPHLAVLGRVGDTATFRNRRNHAVTTYPAILLVRIDENLYFANASHVENRLLEILDRAPDTRHLVLVCSSINFLDSSGLEVLMRLNRKLEREGIRVHLADVKAPVLAQLRMSGLPDELSGAIHFTTDEAVRSLAAGA